MVENLFQAIKDKRIIIPAVILIMLGMTLLMVFSFSGSNSNVTDKSDKTLMVLTDQADIKHSGTTSDNISYPTYSHPAAQIPTDIPMQSAESNYNKDYLTVSSWIAYENPVYILYYPSNWKAESNVFNKGQSMVFKPIALADTYYVPGLVINIQLENPYASVSGQQQQLYQGYGYQTASSLLDGKPITIMTGVFPPASSAPQGSSLPDSYFAYETQYYLDDKGISYQLIYKYPGKKVNNEYELLFQKMLSTFHIKDR